MALKVRNFFLPPLIKNENDGFLASDKVFQPPLIKIEFIISQFSKALFYNALSTRVKIFPARCLNEIRS
jgi:hypothetical protein